MTASPDISVVVPCHNERDNLEPLVTGIRAAIEPLGQSFEIVLVDDGSTDGSWDVLQRLGATDRRVRALRFAYNCGQAAAMWAGMKAANGRAIVTIDADLQNPPRDIPKLVAALTQADCACGSRVEVRARGDNFLRIASSRVANWVRNKLSSETIGDAGCCFRAFRRECIAAVKFYNGAQCFLPTLIKMEGFTVMEVPVSHEPRRAGQAHYGVWNRLFAGSADLLVVRWMKKRMIRYEVAETINWAGVAQDFSQ